MLLLLDITLIYLMYVCIYLSIMRIFIFFFLQISTIEILLIYKLTI